MNVIKNAAFATPEISWGRAINKRGLFKNIQNNGYDAKRIVDISQTRTAAELYFDDAGQYPQVATFAGLSALFVPKYMTQLPVDPLNNGDYSYNYSYSGLTKYMMWAELEQSAAALKSDADIDSTGWTGQAHDGADAAGANCTTAAIDCEYDQGQNQ